MKTICLLFAFVFLLNVKVYSQTDSLTLNLNRAEQFFLARNNQLLTANYQINQAQADIITAKLFDNPEVSYENLLYNHETKRFLETSFATGQYNAEISQLIKLAGKRKKSIALAQAGAKIAAHAYFDLLRTLRFQLRITFYSAYYTHQSAKVYEQEIVSTEQMLQAYQKQYQLGNIAMKDIVRMQSLLISLKTELATLHNELEDNYKDLKILCGIAANTNLNLVMDPDQTAESNIQKIAYSTLLDSAKNNRADYQMAKTTLKLNEVNLKLQQAMAVPDIELAISYDLKGNYPEKYVGLGVKVPIPLFNRNQGEIKKAKIGISAADHEIKYHELLIENEVYNSYQTAIRAEQQYLAIDPKFSVQFDQLMIGLNKNFKERNISLIEYLDFYESYKSNALQLNKLKYERMSTREEINYVTGSNIFN